MNPTYKWALVAAVVIAVGAGGGYYGYRQLRGGSPSSVPTGPAPTVAQPQPTPDQPPAETVVRNPIAPPDAPTAPSLPSLAMSDSSMRVALVSIVGERAFANWFIPESIVRRIVVTVDNLPRAKMSAQQRPVRSVPGSFITTANGEDHVIGADNAARYAPYVDLVRKLDVQRVANVYVRNYPLFQQAYVEQGYPRGYFNDRLVDVVDDLLAAPEVAGPIHLVQPEVMYRFADPSLESLSTGQKILVRMGPDNAAVIKAKLRELRRAIAHAPLAAAGAQGATENPR